jgi:dephospho-CoA kinase
MIITGITGGIGSGKTTVCKVFEMLGVPVYYADNEAKNLLSEPSVQSAITNIFGEDILSGGKVDRKKMAAIVFSDKAKLETLNSIVHPAVIKHFEQWCKKHQSAAYVIKEAAILFESGTYKNVHKIISVTAPVDIKIKRVMKRDGSTEEEVRQKINNQMSDEEKIKRSDFVILNDEEHLIIPEVLKIHKALSGK